MLNGRIDLLLETDAGWILIDHKSESVGARSLGSTGGRVRGAQLGAYSKAVEVASGRTVLENWLVLPVAGGALSIVLS